MIDTSVAWVAFLLQCGAIVFRLRQLAGRRITGPDRAALGIYVFAAFAIASVLPGVYPGIDRLVGVPNATVLLGCCAAITSGWCVQVLHLFVSRSGPDLSAALRRRIRVLLALFALLSALFWLAQPWDEAADVLDFRARYGTEPAVVGLSFVLYGRMALVFWSMAQLSRHYALLSHRPMSRLGLQVATTGAMLGIASCVGEELSSVARGMHQLGLIEGPARAGDILLAVGLFLLLSGNTMPVWGVWLRLPQMLRWIADYRAYVALGPLWRDLCDAFPEVVLESAQDRRLFDFPPPRDIRFRLYRRLVEVLDARLKLRQYLDGSVLQQVTEAQRSSAPDASELSAWTEAVAIEIALQARAAGRIPESAATLSPIPSSAGPADEVSFFCRVARQRRRLPSAVRADIHAWLAGHEHLRAPSRMELHVSDRR